MYKRVLIGLFVCVFTVAKAQTPWTWNFKKVFSSCEIQDTQSCILLTKTDVPLFTQCVVSWNAFRPASGYYTFWVQARHAKSGTWGSWHKMITWGQDTQASFFTRIDDKVVYHHVRLEMSEDDRADGVRIKIEKHDGASFKDVKLLSVALSDFTQFCNEPLEYLQDLSTIKIKGVPRYSQLALDHEKKEVICSPTSLSMVVGYVQGANVDAAQFADNAFDHGLEVYGSWPFNIAHAFEQCNGSMLFRVARCNSFADLHARLVNKMPVVVSVRGAIKGAPQEYNKGHLMVVVGWDRKKQKVLCHDPAWDANHKVYVAYDAESFIRAWERSRRLVYFVEPYRC